MIRTAIRSESNNGNGSVMCVVPVLPSLSRRRHPRTKPKWFPSSISLWTIWWCIAIVALLLCGMSMVYVINTSLISGNASLQTWDDHPLHRNFFMEKPQFYGSTMNHDTSIMRATRSPARLSNNFINTTSLLGCLTNECIDALASTIARAALMRPNRSSWCHTSPVNEKSDEASGRGILLIKVPKGASSTAAGVALRIAARQSCRQVQWRHRWASEVSAFYDDPNDSFVFTTVRDPAARAISSIFFHIVSRTNVTATDAFLIRQLQTNAHPHLGVISQGQGGFQLRYISFDAIPEDSAWTAARPEDVLHPEQVVEHVRRALQRYHFILVPERMDESLVAMALLMNIDVGDVLVSSSKVAGTSQYHLLHPNRTTFTCIPTARSHVSPRVAQYLQSAQWRAMNYGDYLLHAVASQSLDLTIQDTIGPERFQQALEKYHTLQELEQKYCAQHVQFPCSNDGQPQLQVALRNCYLYYYDFGCGYPCIDNIIKDYDTVLSRRT